jgi:hypothetical protein
MNKQCHRHDPCPHGGYFLVKRDCIILITIIMVTPVKSEMLLELDKGT